MYSGTKLELAEVWDTEAFCSRGGVTIARRSSIGVTPIAGTATRRNYHSASVETLDPSWSVLVSPSTPAVDRCVDIFKRPDGTFGFEEFRRDPEDVGAWTPVAYYSTWEYPTEADALSAARETVPWLAGVLDN